MNRLGGQVSACTGFRQGTALRKTAQGRQFHQRAATALEAGDTSGAINHLQMALTFEPTNAGFKELLAELKSS